MSHLNTIIKFFFFFGETVFLVLVVGILVFSSLIRNGNLRLLHSITYIYSYSRIWIAISIAILLCISCAYFGAFNQTKRNGCCAGRRVLLLHSIFLLIFSLLSLKNGKKFSNQLDSINIILDSQLDSRYDLFESKLGTIVNELYFSNDCSGDSNFISSYIDNICPNISSDRCCSQKNECIGNQCCPVVEDRCANDEVSFCPYDNCRFEILDEVRKYIQRLLFCSNSAALLSGTLMILNCLLVCFNPRDDIEVELLKTGVMTESDLEQIKRLKRERKFTYDKGNIDLDALHCDSLSLATEDGLVRRIRKKSSTKIHPDHFDSV